jgi:hypothetical protein
MSTTTGRPKTIEERQMKASRNRRLAKFLPWYQSRSPMRSLLQLLWPSSPRDPRGPDPHAYLRPLIVLLIVAGCGPEVFAAADLIALLDLLGVMLFMTAFRAGVMTLAQSALHRARCIFFPPAWTALVGVRGHRSAVTHGLVLVGANFLMTSMYLLIAVIGTVHVVKLVM